MNGSRKLSPEQQMFPPDKSNEDTPLVFCVALLVNYDVTKYHRCQFQYAHLLRTSRALKTVRYLKGFDKSTFDNHWESSAACQTEESCISIDHSQTVAGCKHTVNPEAYENMLHTVYPETYENTLNFENNKNLLEILNRDSLSVIDVEMNAHLAGCVSKTLILCPRFLNGFQKYVLSKEAGGRHRIRRSKECIKRNRADLRVDKSKEMLKPAIFRLIQINLVYPSYHWLDLAWFYRLEELIIKRALLDDALNWLSTLGGAYSALGDYCPQHAVNAARISMQQLRVALEMGSPPIIVRCHLYLGLSLMQRGRLRKAKNIIREQYNKAKTMPVIDTHLLSMCQGLWSRLRYLYSLRRRSQDSTTQGSSSLKLTS